MAEIASAVLAGYSGALVTSKRAQMDWAGMCRPNPSFTTFLANDGLSFLLIGTPFLLLLVSTDIIACALRTRVAVVVSRQSHTDSRRVHTCIDRRRTSTRL